MLQTLSADSLKHSRFSQLNNTQSITKITMLQGSAIPLPGWPPPGAVPDSRL